MIPRFEILNPKKCIGLKMKMSLSENQTVFLWKNFMQRRKEIQNNMGNDLYSIQLYDVSYFDQFSPSNSFEKWATIEVSDDEKVPEGMEKIIIPEGLYAVFSYKGAVSEGPKVFQYIFGTWLPNSGYTLDNRPHFEILGEKYDNHSPDSEEEIWIPVSKVFSHYTKYT